MITAFSAPETWQGGDYEIAIKYRSRSRAPVRKVLETLWSHPNITGGYGSRDIEPEAQAAADVTALEESAILYGTCVLPCGVTVAARSVAIYEADAPDDGPWQLRFGIPMGSLRHAYPVGAYPFSDGTPLLWREPVDSWFRAVANEIYACAPFDVAFISWETLEDLAEDVARGEISAQRWVGILVPEESGLAWFPATEGAPFAFD